MHVHALSCAWNWSSGFEGPQSERSENQFLPADPAMQKALPYCKKAWMRPRPLREQDPAPTLQRIPFVQMQVALAQTLQRIPFVQM